MEKNKIALGGAAVITLLLLAGTGCGQTADESTYQETSEAPAAETLPPGSGLTTVPYATDATSAPPVTEELNNERTEKSAASAPMASAALKAASLSLRAEALGSGGVKFMWDTDAKLTDANRFIIVRGDKENPEHGMKDYWIRQYQKNREAVWTKQPVGVFHYRICLTENNQNDACVKYSNDALVEVK